MLATRETGNSCAACLGKANCIVLALQLRIRRAINPNVSLRAVALSKRGLREVVLTACMVTQQPILKSGFKSNQVCGCILPTSKKAVC